MESAQGYLQQVWTSNRSPVFPHGKITINGRVSAAAISNQTQAIRDGRATIKGGFSDEIWQLQNNNVAVQLRDNNKMARIGDDSDVPTDIDIEVVDAANGIGDARARTQAQLNEKIHSVYIVGTDKMVAGQTSAVPLILGGLRTLRNTGDQTIYPGSLVAASAPDPQNPQPYGQVQGMPVDKVLWWTVPFSSDTTVGSIGEAHRMLTEKMTAAERRAYAESFPNQAAFTRALERHIRTSAMAAIFSAAETGLVSVNRSATEVNTAKTNFEEVRTNFAYQLGRTLLKVDETAQSDDDVWQALGVSVSGGYAGFSELTDDIVRTKRDVGFLDTLMHHTFSRSPDAWIMKTNEPGRPRNTVDRRIIEEHEENLLRMVAEIRAADSLGRRRVLGRSLSAASPGEYFICHLGNNLIGQ